MESTDLTSMLEDLSDHIDDLEEALKPLLTSTLPDISSRLPLLDKAKLHVFTASAIESLLFSALQLNGTNARTHPVFTEITRVKQYNEKIKLAETAKIVPAKPAVSLDKAAANRFIAHGLAGNDKYDREHAEQRARDNAALATRKDYEANSASLGSMARFRNVGKKRKVDGEDEVEEEIIGQQRQGLELELDTAEKGIARKVAKRQAREERFGSLAQRQERQEREAGDARKVAKKQSRQVEKQKSHKAMRASGAVFQDLLNRPETKK